MGGYAAGLPKIVITPPTPVPPVGTGTLVSYFSEVNAVAVGATESILTYTVAPGATNYLLQVDVSGDNIALYNIYLNGQVLSRLRTYFGAALNASLIISSDGKDGLKLVAGDIIDVRVTNFRPMIADFDARIQYTE